MQRFRVPWLLTLAIAFAGALVTIAPPAQALLVTLEANGVVISNTLTFGPFAGVPAGSAAHMRFDVDSGNYVDIEPGKNRAYFIINDSFLMTAGNGVLHITQGEHVISITNDYWTVDGVHWFYDNLGGNYWMEFELWGNNGTMFPSCDITECYGLYGRGLFADTSWMIDERFYVRFDVLNIHLATSSAPDVDLPTTKDSSWGRVRSLYR
jgi:hypothetical protein